MNDDYLIKLGNIVRRCLGPFTDIRFVVRQDIITTDYTVELSLCKKHVSFLVPTWYLSTDIYNRELELLITKHINELKEANNLANYKGWKSSLSHDDHLDALKYAFTDPMRIIRKEYDKMFKTEVKGVWSVDSPLKIKNVIFNDPATIVYWSDGTKTVVKRGKGEAFDPEKGLAMAIAKRALGNKGNYYETIKKWL